MISDHPCGAHADREYLYLSQATRQLILCKSRIDLPIILHNASSSDLWSCIPHHKAYRADQHSTYPIYTEDWL